MSVKLVSSALQRGFTLLEAIIAIAVLAVGASGLYAWVNTNLKTLQRVDVVTERASLITSATELMQAIDPYEQPEGRVMLGESTISWRTAKPAYEASMRTRDGAVGVNGMGLVRATVEIHSGDSDRLVAQFEMWLLGVRQTRDVADAIFN